MRKVRAGVGVVIAACAELDAALKDHVLLIQICFMYHILPIRIHLIMMYYILLYYTAVGKVR